MSKAQAQSVTGYHIQRRDGNCHIAAIILTATYKGENKTWCMDPNHRPSQNLVSKFKRAKLSEIGINQVIQNKRSKDLPFKPLDEDDLKPPSRTYVSQLKLRRELLRPDFKSNNNGAQPDPDTYSVPDTIPHHFVMMNAFARKQNYSECWVVP